MLSATVGAGEAVSLFSLGVVLLSLLTVGSVSVVALLVLATVLSLSVLFRVSLSVLLATGIVFGSVVVTG